MSVHNVLGWYIMLHVAMCHWMYVIII